MDRAEIISSQLSDHRLDALIVTASADIRWLTGFTGSNGLALIGPQSERTFFTDFRYRQQIDEQLDDRWQRQIEADLVGAAVALLDRLRQGPSLRVGFDDRQMTVATLRAIESDPAAQNLVLVAAGGIVENARMIKEDREIAAIRRTTEIADAAFEHVIAGGLVGRTERDVALALESALRRGGADGVSFAPIVASGSHGALPHAEPREVQIVSDVLVTIDWGAFAGGYCSDCTRTVATGTPAAAMIDIYELVLAAEQAGIDAVRAGIDGREVDAVARTLIEQAGHGDHFGHGLGHGVGIEVHEGPRLSSRSDDTLAAGNVVTVEPGVYVPGLGGVRIEDLLVVTETGSEPLTLIDRQLRTVA